MTDVIEYIHRSTLNMTNLNAVHKIKELDLDYITSSKLTLIRHLRARKK